MDVRDLLEMRTHGDTMFHLQVYEVVLTRGPYQQTVNLHWHAETEFVLVTEGTVRFRVGHQTFDVPAGQAVLVNSEELHSMIAPNDAPSVCQAIVFDLELLCSCGYDRIQHQFIQPLIDKRRRFPTRMEVKWPFEQRIVEQLYEIVRLYGTKVTGYELFIKACLYQVIAELVTHDMLLGDCSSQHLDDERSARLKRVLTYIEDHLSERLRLEDLAAQAHMSEGHFCRFFKEMTQQKPMQYINERRVNLAARLLQDPQRSITSVAMELGFHDVSYFIKVFRAHKHCTPLAYRKRLLQHMSKDST
ncbi:AraC family transcriptional regulator [Alicyclobacillus hesperidum subsp. aegles]|uniref:AraC family transcriptional regulator n=1 Tax=Alicyclobacillus hesperidum TaxID=89784 RepID=UPI000300691E|nr:AraC family transcriptional regulator [Alicyclobacillus hesperidum]GLG01913.1 AraC family transcriptional regulator [Alicyclobacillus hesperidum subsp. aegles]